MKRISIILLIVIFPFMVFAYPKGDVNGNDKVDSTDYILVRKHILKQSILTGDKLARADVNNDGIVSSIDFVAIRKLISNKDSSKGVSIEANKELCEVTLTAKVDDSIKLANKAYSWDNKKTWTNNKSQTVTQDGKYIVYVKDSNNKIYSSEYVVSNIVPTNLKKGIISGSEFNIVEGTGSNITKEIAKNNTDNFNKALQCAHNNGIENLTVEKGTYYFAAYVKTEPLYKDGVKTGCHITERKGIVIDFSNIDLNLNGSEFKVYPNSVSKYDLIRVYNKKDNIDKKKEIENITIRNGTLTGDRYEHHCERGTWSCTKDKYGDGEYNCTAQLCGKSNEQSYGIKSEVNDITIRDMTIKEMMGDGIILYGNNSFAEDNNKKIYIYNNKIKHCRRNGISIINGRNITIKHNNIHDINGINPQVGIDIERDDPKDKYYYKNVTIEDNTIYNNNRRISIVVYPGIRGNLKIINNKLGDQMLFINLGSEGKDSSIKVTSEKESSFTAKTIDQYKYEGIVTISGNSTYGHNNCICSANKPDITKATFVHDCKKCSVGGCIGVIKDGTVKKK